MNYEAVIGLETHVQLKTKSKMWCGCANEFGAPPNTHVCPVCLGLPGVLPVANEEALRLTVLTGLLLNCAIPGFSKFDRKNYFYPDMPKNYQVTQFDKPSTIKGYLDFEQGGEVKRVNITRAHLEEDVGKNFHFDRNSGIDFNRAGVPLLEIVSEPEITSPEMAEDYLNALKDVLIYGGVSDADMEKGMVRCDVNVSIRPIGATELGKKIEIKNMNSFSGVRRALEYEIPRQISVLQSGGKLIQETRRWDDDSGMTEPMRSKEQAQDYRYFPEPDLMPFEPTEPWLAQVSQRVVELPLAKKQRFINDYQLPATDAQTFVWDRPLGEYFESIARQSQNPKAVANWVINNLRAKLTETHSELAGVKFKPAQLVELITLVDSKKISSSAAQQVFADMFETGESPVAIVEKNGLAQVSDTGAIEAICDQVIAANPGPAADFKAGKVAALNFLKGQAMKLSKGKANPAVVGEILERKTQMITGVKSIHFVGVGGTAMASVAAAMRDRGFAVTGSDQNVYPPMSTFLAARKVEVMSGYSESNLSHKPDLVVIGNAISRGNPEAEAVLDRKLRYCSLPELLKEFFIRGKRSIVIAGTHGKTTTTSLMAWVLEHNGLNPSFLIGGIPNNFGEGARFTDSEWFVIEGDEYDTAFFDKRSKFVHYLPEIAIVNNLEFDHADIFENVGAIQTSFKRFINLIPRNGQLLANGDDPNLAPLLNVTHCPVKRFGLGADNAVQAFNIRYGPTATEFEIPSFKFHLNLVGEFNVRNALAVIGCAKHCGLSNKQIQSALDSFKGVKRRMDVRGVVGGVTIIDDFGHHPTAISQTLKALRNRYGSQRIWAIFEPRTNTTRRNVFQRELAESFADADAVIFSQIARLELLKPEERLDPERLIREIKTAGKKAEYLADADAIVAHLRKEAVGGDVVCVFSNGGFGGIHDKLLAAFAARGR